MPWCVDVVHGKVAVDLRSGKRRRVVSYAAPGAVLGLPESVDGCAHQRTAVAKTTCEVHFVPREDVLEIIQDDPLTGIEILQVMSDQVSAMHRTIRAVWPMRGINDAHRKRAGQKERCRKRIGRLEG